MRYHLLILVLFALVVAAASQYPQTETVYVNTSDKEQVKCIFTFHNKNEMTFEIETSVPDTFSKRIQDAQGFMLRFLVQSIKANSFKSFVRYKAVQGEVFQVLLDTDVELIELKKKEYSGTEASAALMQRLAKLENALKVVSRYIPTFDIATVDMGAMVNIDEQYESQTLYETVSNKQVKSKKNESPKRDLTVNSTVDQEFKAATASIMYSFGDFYNLQRVAFITSVFWQCSIDTSRNIAIRKPQKINFLVEVSPDSIIWSLVANYTLFPPEGSLPIDQCQQRKLSDYQIDVLTSRKNHSKFLKITIVRELSQLLTTDFSEVQQCTGGLASEPQWVQQKGFYFLRNRCFSYNVVTRVRELRAHASIGELLL